MYTLNNIMDHKILVFDFDGTIADSLMYLLKVGNRLSKKFNFNKIPSDEMEKLQDKSSQEIIRYLRIPIIKIPAIAAQVKKELNKNIALIKPIKGLKEILIKLHAKKITLGILTSNAPENVHNFLKLNGMDFFDLIYTTSRIWSKHIGLNKIIKTNHFKKEQIIYIGDEIRDIRAAKKAGVKIAAVTWGYNSKKALKAHEPDYLINAPDELLSFFLPTS